MKQGRLVLYLGGVRSGKSQLAEARVQAFAGAGSVAYLATARPLALDKGLTERLKLHQARRPWHWETWESWDTLLECMKKAARRPFKAIFLDGLGMYTSLALKRPAEAFLDDIEVFAKACRRQAGLTVVVADEVGLGGVAGHPVSRAFADRNGLANQLLAKHADEVYSVQAGLALALKKGKAAR
jgi:adenosylcobinamide kinase/adenosylcobinamide-phosphate guanylyltransferase